MGPPVLRANKVPKAPAETMARWVPRVPWELLVPQANQETRDSRAARGRLGHPASPANLAPLAHWEASGLLDLQEFPEMWDHLAPPEG